MLKQFYVENYRNLKLEHPIEFGKVTFFYGNCASGKSNLCKAIGDIVESVVPINLCSDGNVNFKYVFRFEDTDVKIAYTRNSVGRICKFRLVCGTREIKININNDNALETIKHISEDLAKEKKEGDKRIIHLLLQYLTRINIVIDENFRKYCYNKMNICDDVNQNKKNIFKKMCTNYL